MKIQIIDIEKIKPNSSQPREFFDKEKIEELAKSIKETGLLQPISVRPKGRKYEIISGERRWRASKHAGLKKIPVIVKKIDNRQLMIESLIENIHRADLTDFEKAKAIKNIMSNNGFKSKSELARFLGLSPVSVHQYLSILPLEREIKDIAGPNEIGVSVLSSVARIPQKSIRQKIVKSVLRGDINSLEVQKMVPIIRDKKTSESVREAVINNELDLDIADQLKNIGDRRIHDRVIKEIREQKEMNKKIVNRAKYAQEQSERTMLKFFRLKELEKEGVLLNTLWDIGLRKNYAGDPNFHGNSPPQVIEQCILRLTKKNDLILDPMAGSGTIIDVCKEIGRNYVAYDIKPVRNDIIKNDSRKIPLKDESVDMIFLHPPYWNLVKYSRDPADLSNNSLEDFFVGMKNILKECKRVLKNNKYFCILIGDLVDRGSFIPLTRKISNLAEDIGLKDCGNAIKLTRNSVSEIIRGNAIYAELAYTDNLKIRHDTVMFWKKIK